MPGNALSTTVLAQAVTEHNDQVRRHAEVTADRKHVVLDHLVGSQSEVFRGLEEQATKLAEKRETAKEAADLASRRLDQARQAQFTAKAMADTLTRDLARVYDFCNRFSHGEGNESVDVLDARAVHSQIRRSMQFLRAVDSEHFQRMCKATGTDSAVLS